MKKNLRYFILQLSISVSILIVALTVNAQSNQTNTTSSNETKMVDTQTSIEWKKIYIKKDDFSILIPSNYNEYRKSEGYRLDSKVEVNEYRAYHTYLDGAVIILEMYKTNNTKGLLSKLVEQRDRGKLPEGVNREKQNLEGLNGVKYESISSESYNIIEYVAGKEFVYVINAASRNDKNSIFWRFISSLQISQLTPNQFKSDSARQDKADDKSDLTKQISSGNAVANNNTIYTTKEVDRKAKIIWNPPPEYTLDARREQIEAIVKVSVILSADGRAIDAISPPHKLSYGLIEKAIEAAKRVKFLPAEKDSRLVSQSITLEYNFRIY